MTFMTKLVEKTSRAQGRRSHGERDTFMGTVIDKNAYEDYQRFVEIGPRATARCSTAAMC